MTREVIHSRRNVVHLGAIFQIVGETKPQLNKCAIAISKIALPYIQEASAKAEAPSDFMFGRAQPLSYPQYQKTIECVLKQMGVSGMSGYTFRHTVITAIYEVTHDANIASAVAGHSKTSITMNRYTHVRLVSAPKGIQALDEIYHL